jgi:hypothetical protein
LLLSLSSLLVQTLTGKAEGMHISVFIIILSLITKLVTTIYLCASIMELKGEDYSIKACFNRIVKKFFSILAAVTIYTVAVYSGLSIVLAYPEIGILVFFAGIMLFLMFMFAISYIVDKKLWVFNAFKWSLELGSCYRRKIFSIFFAFFAASIIPTLLSVSMSSYNPIIFAFVMTFENTVVTLMIERLTALIYFDLEYGKVTE